MHAVYAQHAAKERVSPLAPKEKIEGATATGKALPKPRCKRIRRWASLGTAAHGDLYSAIAVVPKEPLAQRKLL